MSWSRLFTAVVVVVAACGGAQKTNHYRHASGKQESCCEALGDGAARDACLADIPRIADPAHETAPTNQETFRCVDRHFQCDPATGKATRDSAQAQLDCLNSLEST